MRFRSEKGVALITALLVLLLVSAIVVGMSWMVMSDQRLGGNNQSHETAFYGAEAGMEKLTADLGNTYAIKGDVQSTDITTIEADSPLIPQIQYQNASGNSTYQVWCGTPLALCTAANPPTGSSLTVKPPSPFSGMNALVTSLVLEVAAQSEPSGAEVKLQREVQLLSIPVFQFGVFSQTDLAFFNNHTLDFVGRVHTNGNLWLDPLSTGQVNLHDKVTASGQIIRSNLENGWPLGSTMSATYTGPVEIAISSLPPTEPPGAKWRALALTEGSMNGPLQYSPLPLTGTLNNPTWSGTVEPAYNGMLVSGAPTLDLTTTALGGITNPIFLIRRPVVGEQAANPAEFNQQYFSEASLRILLDDYATPGVPASGCHGSDMMSLDTIDKTLDPVNLAALAVSSPAPTIDGIAWNTTIQAWIPLPASFTKNTSYTPYNLAGSSTYGDGYWVADTTKSSPYSAPIITGCLKIEYRDATNGKFHDITQLILNLGFTGRNINPTAYVVEGGVTPLLPLPIKTQIAPQGPINTANGNNPAATPTTTCTDPSKVTAGDPTGPIIRLARFRDNPAYNAPGTAVCGTTPDIIPSDYWPMVLFDTREGMYRPFYTDALGVTPTNTTVSPTKELGPQITAEGVMNYIELDAANLASWFNTNQLIMTGGIWNNLGFAVYFSDRRGEQLDPNAANTRTGSFGFNDVVNSGDAAWGCPNGIFDGGGGGPEDFEGDSIFRTYGQYSVFNAANTAASTIPFLLAGGTGLLPTISPYYLPASGTATMAVMQNPNCGTVYKTLWPGATYVHTQEARENPPLFFRRALKIVNGVSLNLGTSCYGASPNPPCGLAIASENPVYVQGDFNAAYNPASPWVITTGGVAASVSADAVTLLSDNWNDVNSFINPYDSGYRAGVETSYRMGIIAGKQIPFTWPGGTTSVDFGTDGGIQNFPHLLEDWQAGGTQDLNYMGSFVSFYFSRQALGLYGYSNTGVTGGLGPVLFNPPTRNWSFDTNFSTGPQWLPPDTPLLRTINTTGFSQMLMPTQ